MSAALQPRTEIRNMSNRDLRGVSAVEQASYEFPWNPGIFRDCLLAGYQCLVLVTDGDVNGYAIMSVAASEAHILNLCVHPELQQQGFGRSCSTPCALAPWRWASSAPFSKSGLPTMRR